MREVCRLWNQRALETILFQVSLGWRLLPTRQREALFPWSLDEPGTYRNVRAVRIL